MLYIERKPALPLRRFVRSLWYANAPAVHHPRERILPSGNAQIVISLSRDFLLECSHDGLERRTAPALMVGQRSVFEIIATSDLVDLAGVLFEPGALPVFLGDRADLLSNQSVPLPQVWCGSPALRDRMLGTSSPKERLCVLEQFLFSLLSESAPEPAFHPAVEFALKQLEWQSNGLSVAELAKASGWSERRFSHIFREQVGFPPKVWARLQRFQHAVRQLRAGGSVTWAELALQCGFYDQAHFANEFRCFSGMDVTTYSASFHELWANHTLAG